MKNNRNSKKKYKAVIIGAGKIGSGFDTPKSRTILTHAHALSNNPHVDLVGISDINSVRGNAEAKKWNTTFFSDTHRMLNETKPDIVVIATPSSTHKTLLLESLKQKPKVIILEKPAVDTKTEIISVRRAAKKSGVPVIVNFRRRFDDTVNEVREALVKGTYGRVLLASALYSKGILHNGSHLIDLARYFFGEMTTGKMSFAVDDFPDGAPSLGGVATFERCPQFYFMAGDEQSFYVFEMTIMTEKYRIRFINEGRDITIEQVVRDTVYPDDHVLGKGKIRKTKLANAMVRMVEHAVRVADGKEISRASLEDALLTQETCYTLFASLKK